jgi:outer membrane lipoprotein-sorting protein
MTRTGIAGTAIAVLLALFALPCLHAPAEAYLPGAPEILERLAAAAAGTETLQGKARLALLPNAGNPAVLPVLDQQISLRAPDSYRAETRREGGVDIALACGHRSLAMIPDGRGIRNSLISTLPAVLFLRKPVEDLLAALSFLGTRTGEIALERVDGKIAYVIGKSDDEAIGSRLWIDKETGLPLRFEAWGVREGRPVPLRVNFGSYREIRKGVPFPMELAYSVGGVPAARLTFRDVVMNVPLQEALFSVPCREDSPYPPLEGFLDPRE